MKLLVLRHVPHEHLGIIADILKEKGIQYEYANLYEDDSELTVAGYQGLVILGGPMNVYEADRYPFLPREEALIKDAILKRIPVLGICLGAQLIAKALGARVYPNRDKEIGWYQLEITDTGMADPLIRDFNMNEIVFQWHGDTFDIPEGAVQLFYSPLCRNQAFRFGDRVYGLQFHLEVTPQMVEEWLTEPVNAQEMEELKGIIESGDIRNKTKGYIERLNQLAVSFFNGFCGLVLSGGAIKG